MTVTPDLDTPEGWVPTKLRHLLKLNPPVPTALRSSQDEVSFLPMELIGEDGSLDLSRARPVQDVLTGYSYYANGDVLMAKVTPCFENGKAALVRNLPSEYGFGTTEVTTLRPGPNLQQAFLGYLIRTDLFRQSGIASMTGAGGLKRVPDEHVREFRIALPPIAVQAMIADFLDRETAKIDALIAKQEQLIATLQERRGAIADQLLNAPGFVQPLKRIVADVTVGIVVTPSAWYAEGEDGVPALRGLNIRPGLITTEDLVYLTHEGDVLHAKSRLRAGDVVMVRTGQAGSAAVVPRRLEGANAIDLLIVRPGRKADPDFLVAYFNAPSTREKIAHGSVGAIQGHFNVSALRELEFPSIDLAEQRRRADEWFVQSGTVDALIVKAQEVIEVLKEYRSALITDAVTGKIDVRGVA